MSPFSNPFLLVAVVVALAVHIGALYLPPTQFVLRVEPIGLGAWIRMVLVASTIVFAIELHKLLRRGKCSGSRPRYGEVPQGRSWSHLLR